MEFFDFDGASESVDRLSTRQMQDDRELDCDRSLLCLNDDSSNFSDAPSGQGITVGQGLAVNTNAFGDDVIDNVCPAQTQEYHHYRASSAGQDANGPSRFSKKTKRILNNWLAEHAAHPYATDVEKTRLKVMTGLTMTQISNWLANARRRGKSNPDMTSAPRLWAIPRRALAPDMSISDMNPLERWTFVPPEREPVAPTDLLRAFLSRDKPTERLTYVIWDDHDGPAFSHLDSAPSESQISTERNSTSTDPTSLYSHHSPLALSRNGFARRRRPKTRSSASSASSRSKKHKSFQCTFCLESFSTKYDWQRHEKSLHLPLDSWTCTPLGAIEIHENKILCAFCHAQNPDRDHLEEHNYEDCRDKACADRSFLRKDHLAQHLRLMHNVKFSSWMSSWRHTRDDIKSRCGFCGTSFSSWKVRVEHLTYHFKQGTTMSDWKGGRGFDSDVEQLVENARCPETMIKIPPSYLDGIAAVITPQTQGKTNKGRPRHQHNNVQPSSLSYVQCSDSSPSPTGHQSLTQQHIMSPATSR
ncbi:hypothetical protein KEM54_006852 [Ascosphaera aggregata]|nr:hypothetical protein KEM54_006852 [Ascosphaera aggregata]